MSDAARAFMDRHGVVWHRETAEALLDRYAAEQTAALREALEELRRQMDHPDLDPAFSATMKRMIDRALLADAEGPR